MLNDKGQVIGVSVATFRGGQNLNFAIPSNYLKKLMEQMGPAKPLSKAKSTESKQSIFADLGGRSVEGVSGGKLTWRYRTALGPYAFSLRNHLRENVRDVYCFVIFYDVQGDPIDVDVVHFRDPIPAGLAKRVKSEVDGSVQKLTTRQGAMSPHTKVEFRILDFEVME